MIVIRNTQGLVCKSGINKGSKRKKTGLKYSAGIDKNPVYSVAGFDRFYCIFMSSFTTVILYNRIKKHY